MKKLFLYLMLACWVLAACKKNLNEVPLSSLAPENFYKTPADGITSVNGCYQSLKDNFISRAYGVNVFLDNLTDFHNGEVVNFGPLQNNTLASSNIHNENWWTRSYATIGACNITIGRVEASEIDEIIKKRVIGEARFLRALNYFYIVQVWGPAPLKVKIPQASEDVNSPRESIEKIYEVIIDDLKYAEENCWNVAEAKTSNGVTYTNEKGRATKGAAKALLAKVYLKIASSAKASKRRTDVALTNAKTGQVDGLEAYKKFDEAAYFALCIQKCNEIEALGYRLNTNYMANFDTKAKNGIESIFEIQAFGQIEYGSRLAPFYSPPYSGLYGGTWGGIAAVHRTFSLYGPFRIFKVSDYVYRPAITGDLASRITKFAFDVTDARYKNGFVHSYTNSSNKISYLWDAGTARYVGTPSGQDVKFYTAKYIDREGKIADDNSNNWILLRFADVLLMKAECLFETGNWNGAWDLLKRVHTRDGNQNLETGNLYPSTYSGWIALFSGATDEEKFREAILYERFIELLYEDPRFFDLSRMGKLEEKCAVLGRTRTRKAYYLPISQTEMDTNANISQEDNNPGYETVK